MIQHEITTTTNKRKLPKALRCSAASHSRACCRDCFITFSGTNFNVIQIKTGTIIKSSRKPNKGITSGIKSIGLTAYAAVIKATDFVTKGVAGFFRTNHKTITSFLSSLSRFVIFLKIFTLQFQSFQRSSEHSIPRA